MKIVLSGIIVGTGWYSQSCWKTFSEEFSTDKNKPFAYEWVSLRDALLRITNDGDFQSCLLLECYLQVTIPTRKYQIEAGKELREYPHENTSDCFVPEEKYWEYYDAIHGWGRE